MTSFFARPTIGAVHGLDRARVALHEHVGSAQGSVKIRVAHRKQLLVFGERCEPELGFRHDGQGPLRAGQDVIEVEVPLGVVDVRQVVASQEAGEPRKLLGDRAAACGDDLVDGAVDIPDQARLVFHLFELRGDIRDEDRVVPSSNTERSSSTWFEVLP